MKVLRTLGMRLLALAYPPRCPICDEVLAHGEEGCCARCAPRLPWVRGPVCMRCGKPVADETEEFCENCARQEHFFDRGVAAFTYTQALRHSVYRMKAENRRDYLPFFARAMVSAAVPRLQSWRPEMILPVPMHPRRRRIRGYNQSELLAEEIGRRTGIPVGKKLLRCTRMTASQKALGRRERMRNLRGSFEVCEPFPEMSSVLLVDDVYTTGSTMDEISRVLKARGVRNVYFVVLCTGKGKKAVCTAPKV